MNHTHLIRTAAVCCALFLTMGAGRTASRTQPPPKLEWSLTFAGFNALAQRQGLVGKAFGNALMPMWLSTLAQRRFVTMYGKFHGSEPFHWLAYRNARGRLAIVFLYPSIDRVAKMTLNHPGAERRARDMVFLPKDEGRPSDSFAVFPPTGTYCAIAPTEALARQALAEKLSPGEQNLFRLSSGGVTGDFDFEQDGFVYRSVTSTGENAARLAKIPYFGPLVGNGATHKITFDDIKKLIAALTRQLIQKKTGDL